MFRLIAGAVLVLFVASANAQTAKTSTIHAEIARHVGPAKVLKLLPGAEVIEFVLDVINRRGKTIPGKTSIRILPAAMCCRMAVLEARGQYSVPVVHEHRLRGRLTATRFYSVRGEFSVDLDGISEKHLAYDKDRKVLYVFV